VATGGLIDIVSALVPHSVLGFGLLARLAPHVTSPAAHALVVPAGVLLLITARGLIRRNQRAWRLAAGLLGLSLLLPVLRGPDYPGAIVTGLIAVALLARREDFPFTGDPSVRCRGPAATGSRASRSTSPRSPACSPAMGDFQPGGGSSAGHCSVSKASWPCNWTTCSSSTASSTLPGSPAT
jgi:hypothetical protein